MQEFLKLVFQNLRGSGVIALRMLVFLSRRAIVIFAANA